MRRAVTGAFVAATLLAACSTSSGSAPADASAAAESDGLAAETASASSARESAAPSVAAASEQPPELAWSQLVAEGPAAREDHTWTVGDDGRAYLFGGRDGATVHGDLWEYDLETDTWSQLAPASSPAPRFGHEAEWVDGIGLVIFAGQAGPTFFNDLWAYDPDANAWAELPASGDVPVARYGTCAGIAPDGRLWISHGFTADQVRFADTVAYDFETGVWTDETPDAPLPVNRCLHGCWWTDAGELALYGGQTTGVAALGDYWRLADGAWSLLEGSLPEDRNLYAKARVSGATLVFGGQAVDGSYLADAYLFTDGATGAEAVSPVTPGPSGRAGAEMVVDPERGRVLLFGGRDATSAYADLWELTGLEALANAGGQR